MKPLVVVRTEEGSPARTARPFAAEVLRIDAAAELERTRSAICDQVLRRLHKRGAVIGLSGGIDSSVTAALCAAAVGPEHVLALFMPERDSDPESLDLSRQVASWLGIPSVLEDIEPMLSAAGCYRRRDELVRRLVPEFGPSWRCKVVLGNVLDKPAYNISSLVVASPAGEVKRVRMPLEIYLGVIAATNMKQRTRKQIEYTHADRLGYAVAGTANRLEHDQGFFVKNGDGAADLKPIAHLYKSQVYQLAEYLGVPEAVRRRQPTSDTWSLAQTQDEFYFSLPHPLLDLCLYALNHGVGAGAAADATGLSATQVQLVWRDILAKRKATRYLHQAPLLVKPVTEI